MKKRILSIALCICMVLTLLPTAALADDDANTGNSSEGTPVAQSINNTPILLSQATEDANGDGWSWVQQTKTLTLNGLDLSAFTNYGITLPGGATIQLIGNNKVNGSMTTRSGYTAIMCFGSITISGTGSLDVGYSNGGAIYTSAGNLTIDGATVTAHNTGATAVYAVSGGITIENGAQVTIASDAINSADTDTAGGGMRSDTGKVAISGDTTAVNIGGYWGLVSGANSLDSELKITSGTLTVANTANNMNNIASFGTITMGGNGALYINKALSNTLTSGIVFVGKAGTVYGTVSRSADLTVKSGETLTIPAGSALIIREGATLTNNGTITNNGSVYMLGTLSGTAISGNETQGKTTVQCGTYTVYGLAADYTYASNTITLKNGADIEVANADGNTPAVERITIPAGVAATVTLNGVTVNYVNAISVYSNGAVTLKLKGNNQIGTGISIDKNGLLKCISVDGGTLTAYGSNGGTYGSGIYDFSGAVVNTVVTDWSTSTMTTYGKAILQSDLSSNYPLTVPKDTKLTVPQGITLQLKGALPTIKGELVNNGTVVLADGTSGEQIKALNISGTGVVKIGENTYSNSGVALHTSTTALDFSKPAGTGEDQGNWDASATLESHGYTWDAATATLTLKNFRLTASTSSAITLPAQSNLVLEGDNTVVSRSGDGIRTAETITKNDTLTIAGTGSLTACPSSDKKGILAQGALVIKSGTVTCTGGTYGIRTDESLTVEGGTVNAQSENGISSERTMAVKGGTVTATATGSIGDGLDGNEVTLSGGTITATGTGYGVNATDLTITGGTVNIHGGKSAVSVTSLTLSGVSILSPAGAAVGSDGQTILLNGQMVKEVSIGRTPSTGSGSPGTVTAKGDTVTVTGSNGAVSDSAISSAVTNAGKGGAVSIEAPNSASTTLTGTAAAAVGDNGSALNLTVMGGGQIAVQPEILQALNLKTTDKVSVGMTSVTSTIPNAIAFEVNLAVNSTSIHELGGSMSIDLPVKAAWNGLAAIVEHLHVNGSKTYEKVSIANGKAPVTVTDLSTFTVRLASDVPAAAFTDLKAEDWSFGGIAYAVEQGLFAGTSASTFAPNSPMTRQQMWMVLARLSGQTPASMDAAKEWAVSNGISDGSKPTAAVTRQQMVTVLYRYSQKFCSLADEDSGSMGLAGYTDSGSIAAYAYDAMHWAVRSGIVQGNGDKLNPAGNTTRAQFAVILSRYDQSGK